jgi:DNA-directed RNA polymerase specialized sigma subunit
MPEKMRLENLSTDDLLSLLASQPTKEDEIREEILQRTTSLIDETISEAFPRSGFSHDELFRAGYLGLLNATYNIEFSHEQQFCEYAKNLIKGEIRQHIREHVQRVKFPHWLKDLNRYIEKTQVRLLHDLKRLPTLSELSDAVNLTEEAIAEVLKAREALNYVSLDEEQRQNDPLPIVDQAKIRNKHPEAFSIQHRIRIAAALEKLGELQQYLFNNLFPTADQ